MASVPGTNGFSRLHFVRVYEHTPHMEVGRYRDEEKSAVRTIMIGTLNDLTRSPLRPFDGAVVRSLLQKLHRSQKLAG